LIPIDWLGLEHNITILFLMMPSLVVLETKPNRLNSWCPIGNVWQAC